MTGLVYGSNTNYQRADKYVDLLAKKNLLKCVGSNPRLYRTTNSGKETARILGGVEEFILGNDGASVTPEVLREQASASPVNMNGMRLSDVRRSFADLSRICKPRSGPRCILRDGECKLGVYLFCVADDYALQRGLLRGPAVT